MRTFPKLRTHTIQSYIARSVTKYIRIVGIHQVTSFIKSEHFSIEATVCYLYLKTAFDLNDAVRIFETSPPW
jgi:hypothetical protein